MIKLKTLLIEAVAKVKLLSPEEFEKKGGYTIGIGAGTKLYTLRTEFWDTIGIFDSYSQTKIAKQVRRSYHIRNLGKDWAQVVEKLPKILNGSSIFVPNYVSGKLDPNHPPVPIVIPDKFPFGKYNGKTIEEVAAVDLNYLLWLSTASTISPRKKAFYGFVQKVREFLGETLENYIKEQDRKAAEVKRKEQDSIKRLEPLAKFLESLPYRSSFTDSIALGLRRGEVPIGRGGGIIQDIYAKWYEGNSRRGSKEYIRKEQEFYDLFVKGDEERWRW